MCCCGKEEGAAHGFNCFLDAFGAHAMQCTQKSTGMVMLIMRCAARITAQKSDSSSQRPL